MRPFVFLVVLILSASCFAAESPLDPDTWGLDIVGNAQSLEARLFAIGDTGYTIGGYVGLAEDIITGDADVVGFGAIATYPVIEGGNLPVGNLFPDTIGGFIGFLPDTVVCDAYFGVKAGALYIDQPLDNAEEGELDFSISWLAGLRAGPVVVEGQWTPGTTWGKDLADVQDHWQVVAGVEGRW